MTLSRRTLLGAAAAAPLVPGIAAGQRRSSNAARFSLAYAPHEGSFASRGGGSNRSPMPLIRASPRGRITRRRRGRWPSRSRWPGRSRNAA
ncbi:hypothetical protein QP162_08280 [Sphingomonas aurantiaca]|uniref:hypothetical protein n=1 Tax=Sphingomonas aurantiaca TaxID=185949 RepID=UPI002FE41C64